MIERGKSIVKKLLEYRRINKLEKVYTNRVKNELLHAEDNISEEYRGEIKNFWQQFGVDINTDYHKWYSSRNGIEDPRYISEDIFYLNIVPAFNNLEFADGFADKSYYDLLFPKVNKPVTYVKNINGFYYDHNFNPLTKEKALEICSESNKLIVKPTIDSGGGKGIQLVTGNSIEEIKNNLQESFTASSKNFIVQDFIRQHPMTSELNSTSVNTVRVFSFLRNEGVAILGSHIRTGKAGSFQDHFGIIYGIDDNGYLYDFGIKSHAGNKLYSDDLNIDIEQLYIPNFDKIIRTIKTEHSKLSHFRLVAWDFAINENGEPLLVEFNIKAPGINNHQLIDGPLFGEYTDEVLNEVFK